MTQDRKKTVGRVCLVGAGPGDPGLITVRGLERLRQADVVVYDALVEQVLLGEAGAEAEMVDVGKRAGAHTLSQDGINQLLVDKARQGKLVVRLKGGDPYLFGRGAEEAAFVAGQGIEVEIIPGITAGLAAPAMAGIPVTHRKFASSVTLVTGHEDPTKGETSLDYSALAGLIRAGGTVCIYMGAARLSVISQSLQQAGLRGDTPTAVVQWGTTTKQKSVRSELNMAAEDAERAGLGAPAIIVIGAVAAIDEPGLDWFTARPLFGQRILVTRTRQQASDLSRLLCEQGAMVLEAPTIEVVPAPPEVLTEVDGALKDLRAGDWLVLTSANGVEALAERLQHLNFDARHLTGVKIASVGDTTRQELWSRLRLRADFVPLKTSGEALAAELIAQHSVAGKRFLLLRADIARPALPKLLAEAGANVTEFAVYQTNRSATLPSEVLDALRASQVDWITFTSSSTASNLVELLGQERDLIKKARIASIGPITSETLRQLGLPPNVEATTATVQGLVDVIVTSRQERPGNK